MRTKIFITNITEDILKTDGRKEITAIGLRQLRCDRQCDGCDIERNTIAILHPDEYQEVIKYGYYTIDSQP